MTAHRALPFFWDAEDCCMRPMANYRDTARKNYVDQQQYLMEEAEERSTVSHRHFFACIRKAWNSLPEDKQDEYPSTEHLRKRALIKCKFYNLKIYTCADAAHANELAGIIQAIDEFALIIVSDDVVKIYTARSVAPSKMKPEEFQRAKEAVLWLLSDMIGTDVATLKKEGSQ